MSLLIKSAERFPLNFGGSWLSWKVVVLERHAIKNATVFSLLKLRMTTYNCSSEVAQRNQDLKLSRWLVVF